jgi:hypothetical protein
MSLSLGCRAVGLSRSAAASLGSCSPAVARPLRPGLGCWDPSQSIRESRVDTRCRVAFLVSAIEGRGGPPIRVSVHPAT